MSAAPEPSFAATEGSPAAPLAAALEWLWRPAGGKAGVGFGVAEEAESLTMRVSDGDLAGAVIFEESTAQGAEGEARFAEGMRLRGSFGLLDDEGEPWTSSSLGVHAVADDRVLTLAAPPDGWWGTLRFAWVAEAIARFAEERLELELRRLPAIGCLRLDDIPGTAEFQLENKAKDDRTQTKLARSLAKAAADNDAVLNIAVACMALGPEKEPVPLQDVWPKAIEALRAGVAKGTFEPVCHGWLGLVPEALAKGEIDFHEYEPLDADQAMERLREVVAWQRENLGEAPTFVAVDWTYGEGARYAAARLGLTSWLRPELGPLAEPAAVRETLTGTLDGIAGIDFTPLAVLAKVGVPPTVTLHGRSLDRRRETLALPTDAASLAKAMAKRDIYRLLELDGVRWLGAKQFTEAITAHGEA